MQSELPKCGFSVSWRLLASQGLVTELKFLYPSWHFGSPFFLCDSLHAITLQFCLHVWYSLFCLIMFADNTVHCDLCLIYWGSCFYHFCFVIFHNFHFFAEFLFHIANFLVWLSLGLIPWLHLSVYLNPILVIFNISVVNYLSDISANLLSLDLHVHLLLWKFGG
jgi:hypothetical protein